MFQNRNDQILDMSCRTICSHFEQHEGVNLSCDQTLMVSIDNFASYLDIDTGFGEDYNGQATFKVAGQNAIRITVVDNKMSLTEIFPKLKNSAARGIPRTAVYSKKVADLIYQCWEQLLGSAEPLNYQQIVFFHDLISNHQGLQCHHVGIAQRPDDCPSCSAR